MQDTLSLPRSQWICALTQLDDTHIIKIVTELTKQWSVVPVSPAKAGLGALKFEDSTMGQPFFIGEFPLSIAHIQITTTEGHTVEGAAQVMHDNQQFAESLAICDAILAEQLPGFDVIKQLVIEGQQRFEQQQQVRKRILASTKVDFSLMEDADDNQDQQVKDNTHVTS